MTNLQAYMSYNADGAKALASLSLLGIDPEKDDKNRVSMALGMIDFSMSATSYKQGNTQETYSASAMSRLYSRGLAILQQEGIDVDELYSDPEVWGQPYN